MNREEIRKTLVDFLGKKGSLPETEEALLSCEYLEQGIIDSMGLIEMITTLEETLKFRFSAEDFQKFEFRTIGGLIELICQLKNA